MRLSEWHHFSASAYVSPGPDLTMVAHGDILVFRGIRRKDDAVVKNPPVNVRDTRDRHKFDP